MKTSQLAQRIWKVVCCSDVCNDANIFEGRFEPAKKCDRKKWEKLKAQFLVQGHRDKVKFQLIHIVSVPNQHTTKMLVGVTAIVGIRLVWTEVIPIYKSWQRKWNKHIFNLPERSSNWNLVNCWNWSKSSTDMVKEFIIEIEHSRRIRKRNLQWAGVFLLLQCSKSLLDNSSLKCALCMRGRISMCWKEKYSDLCKTPKKNVMYKDGKVNQLLFAGVQIENKKTFVKLTQTYTSKLENYLMTQYMVHMNHFVPNLFVSSSKPC